MTAALEPATLEPAPGLRADSPGRHMPLEVLFGSPERLNPQLSPDGTRLAYAAPDARGVLQVWVRTRGRQDDRPITDDQTRGIRTFVWAGGGAQILYLQDRDGDESWHLYAVYLDTPGAPARDLTPFEGIQAQIVAVEPRAPEQALIALNRDDRRRHDVYRLDLRDGRLDLDTHNPGGVVQWVADAQLYVRAAVATTRDGGKRVLVREGDTGSWRTLLHWAADDDGRAIGFSEDGGTLYVAGSHGANAQRLVAVEVGSGREQVLAGDAQYDVAEVLVDPVHRRPEAVAFHRARIEWQPLDEKTAAHFAILRREVAGQLAVVSRTAAGDVWIVSATVPDGPIRYYVYDCSLGRVELLFSHRSALESVCLAPSEPVAFVSRDGLTLHGYLTRPQRRSSGAGPGPAMLLVHGGPWERDGWRFDPAVQFLADRGVTVLQVNFRGSSGYGKAFLHAGDREWGAAMQTDLVDGAEWLVARGLADPRRIGIMGVSYGGYAALCGLAFFPAVFCAGISVAGPSNLVSLLQSIPPQWAPLRAMLAHRVGDPDSEADFLRSRSPLFVADRIAAPLLVCQGANDPRVPRAESEQIVDALRAAGKDVEYCLYEDEGHGLLRPANRLDFFRRVERFLERHLS